MSDKLHWALAFRYFSKPVQDLVLGFQSSARMDSQIGLPLRSDVIIIIFVYWKKIDVRPQTQPFRIHLISNWLGRKLNYRHSKNDYSRLLQESHLIARQTRRAPNHVNTSNFANTATYWMKGWSIF